MTPAQWSHLAHAHAEREGVERKFVVSMIEQSFEALKDMLMALIGSRANLPATAPKEMFIPLITALATDERIKQFREVQQGGNMSEESGRSFLDSLRARAEAGKGQLPPEFENPEKFMVDITDAANGGAVIDTARIAIDADKGSFDDPYDIFKQYVDPD